MRLCHSTFLLVTCFTCLGFGPGVVIIGSGYKSPAIAASTESLEMAASSSAVAEMPRGTASQKRSQADDVKITLIAANQTTQASVTVCRSQWAWLWWVLVLVGVLGSVGALRYLQKRFGKASRGELAQREVEVTNPDSYHSSANGGPVNDGPNRSYNRNTSIHLEVEAVESPLIEGETAQLQTEILPVEQTTRLAKISIADELLKDLHSPDPGKRRKAIWDLGQHGDSRSVQPLVELMLDSDSKQRSLILAAVAEIGSRTLKPMNRALVTSLQDESPEVRKNAIRDLTRIYDQMAQMSQLLCHAIDDPDAEVQETARYAITQMNRIRALPPDREGGSGGDGEMGRWGDGEKK